MGYPLRQTMTAARARSSRSATLGARTNIPAMPAFSATSSTA